MLRHWAVLVLVVVVMGMSGFAARAEGAAMKALIIDGQNNHNWAATTPEIKRALEQTGLFQVDVLTSPSAAPQGPAKLKGTPTPAQQAAFNAAKVKFEEQKAEYARTIAERWAKFQPKFSDYSVVVSNYNGDEWPAEVKTAFVEYVKNGGGFVTVHAADNSFPKWAEYNEIIGLGGWGGRNEKDGPLVRWRDGKMVLDTTPHSAGHHGAQKPFLIEVRDKQHPITAGLPEKWVHCADELYQYLRGPAKNLTVLATAYADPANKGSGENEPVLFTVTYGKGRVFHTVLGHDVKQMRDVGFIVTLQRGTEWAATGKVTQTKLPADFPGAETPSIRVNVNAKEVTERRKGQG